MEKKHAIHATTTPVSGEPQRSVSLDDEGGIDAFVARLFAKVDVGYAELPSLVPLEKHVAQLQAATDGPALVALLEAEPLLAGLVIREANRVRSTDGTARQPHAASLPEAVARIGEGEVASACQAVLLRDRSRAALDAALPHLRRVWTNTLFTAFGSRELARGLSHPAPDEVLLAGLFHNIGELLLIASLADQAKLDPAGFFSGPVVRRLVAEHHGRVGARLLASWHFPAKVVKLALDHDGPIDSELHALVTAAHQAALEYGYAYASAAFDSRRLAEALAYLGLSYSRTAALPEQIGDALNAALSTRT